MYGYYINYIIFIYCHNCTSTCIPRALGWLMSLCSVSPLWQKKLIGLHVTGAQFPCPICMLLLKLPVGARLSLDSSVRLRINVTSFITESIHVTESVIIQMINYVGVAMVEFKFYSVQSSIEIQYVLQLVAFCRTCFPNVLYTVSS